jgi:hypothetical protein
VADIYFNRVEIAALNDSFLMAFSHSIDGPVQAVPAATIYGRWYCDSNRY